MGLEQTRRPPAPRDFFHIHNGLLFIPDIHSKRTFVDDVDPASREPVESDELARLHWTQEKLAEG